MLLDLINDVFDINLRGFYILLCEVVKCFIDWKFLGWMVNILFVGVYCYDGNGVVFYLIMKMGIVCMMEVFVVEWVCYNINVNGIVFGVFESEMMDGMLECMGDIV